MTFSECAKRRYDNSFGAVVEISTAKQVAVNRLGNNAVALLDLRYNTDQKNIPITIYGQHIASVHDNLQEIVHTVLLGVRSRESVLKANFNMTTILHYSRAKGDR